MTARRVLLATLLAIFASAAIATPAAAQDELVGNVEISFEIGPYDADIDDFPVSAVIVEGNLEDGKDVTVEIKGTGGRVLWSGTAPFHAPSITIDVDELVPVGEVASAGVAQAREPVVAGVVIEPPEVFHSSGGGAAGSGQLGLSMVVIIALFAILFRTPLPSASTQRWIR